MNVHQEVEFLREENRQLRQSLAGKAHDFPVAWELTGAEQRLLNSLYSASNGFRTHDALLRAVALSDAVEENLLKVQISRVRKKLKPHGITIKTVWGEGYEISADSKTLITNHLSTKPNFTLDHQGVRA